MADRPLPVVRDRSNATGGRSQQPAPGSRLAGTSPGSRRAALPVVLRQELRTVSGASASPEAPLGWVATWPGQDRPLGLVHADKTCLIRRSKPDIWGAIQTRHATERDALHLKHCRSCSE